MTLRVIAAGFSGYCCHWLLRLTLRQMPCRFQSLHTPLSHAFSPLMMPLFSPILIAFRHWWCIIAISCQISFSAISFRFHRCWFSFRQLFHWSAGQGRWYWPVDADAVLPPAEASCQLAFADAASWCQLILLMMPAAATLIRCHFFRFFSTPLISHTTLRFDVDCR